MDSKYYKLPLNFASVFDEEGGKMQGCSEVQSIDQYLELILMTCPGEHKFDKNFGCRIWEMDFENVVSRKEWLNKFTSFVKDAIIKYEIRLNSINIEINVNDVIYPDFVSQTTAIKKEVSINISSVLISSGEQCRFNYALLLGPLSTE